MEAVVVVSVRTDFVEIKAVRAALEVLAVRGRPVVAAGADAVEFEINDATSSGKENDVTVWSCEPSASDTIECRP